MKVLYVIDTLETGGAERSILEIASRLRTITPVVCSLYRGSGLKPEFEAAGIKVISCDLSGPYEFVNAYRCLSRVCEIEKPEIILSSLYRSGIVARLVGWQKKILHVGSFVNDSYSDEKISTLSLIGRIKYKFFYWIDRITASRSYAYISNSESIKKSNSKNLKVPLERIWTIYRGRTISKQVPASKLLDTDKIQFLNVGRLLQRKGQKELISAFAVFSRNYPNSSLLIAGEGPFRGELERHISSLGLNDSVTLLGNVSNVSELYQRCDCLVFPSYYEGFSGVLVEAMLHKIPVLASNIAMNQEAIDHLKTGYIFNVRDDVEILAAMNWFSANRALASELAERAYQTASVRFDIQHIARQHEDLYITLIKRFYTR